METMRCTACNGSGEVVTITSCYRCEGSGELEFTQERWEQSREYKDLRQKELKMLAEWGTLKDLRTQTDQSQEATV